MEKRSPFVLNYAKVKHNLQSKFNMQEKDHVLTWCRGRYRDDRHFRGININFRKFPNSVFCLPLRDRFGNPIVFADQHTHIHYCSFTSRGGLEKGEGYFVLLVYNPDLR